MVKHRIEKDNNLYINEDQQDLEEMKRYLVGQGEIVVDFPAHEWEHAMLVISGEMKEFQGDATRKYVGTKILKELEAKYPVLKREYNGSKHLPIFQMGDEKTYKEKSSYIYNVYDVRDILEVEDIHPERIHLFMNQIRSPLLRDAILILFSNNTGCDINLYSSNPEPKNDDEEIKAFFQSISKKEK